MTLSRLFLALPLIGAALLTPAPLALAQVRQQMPDLNATGRALLADLTQAGQELAGEALAQWIAASRNDAVRAGVQPIPVGVRAQLDGHFPDALLDRVRYRIGTGNEFSLQANAFKGNAVAITLDDIILFKPDRDLVTDARLWAHELTHVQQYERWGVRGFARRYTLDHLGVEREAQAAATNYEQKRGVR
jgi:hypothetical protein